MRARSSRAPAPVRTANRAPVIFAARSKSRMPSASPRSQWLLAGAVNVGGDPHRLAYRVAARVFSCWDRGMWKIRDAEIQIGQGLFDTP